MSERQVLLPVSSVELVAFPVTQAKQAMPLSPEHFHRFDEASCHTIEGMR